MNSLDNLYPRERTWEYENGFYLTSDISRIGKLVAHFELYKRIVDLPGHVVELGVYKGTSLVRFATFRDLLESPCSRKIIGFDAFGTFPRDDLSDIDSRFVESFESAGGDGYSPKVIAEALAWKGLGRTELVVGDVRTTLPDYVAEHPELRIALLHLDMDVFAPTSVALDLLAPRVVAGGLLVVDDYGAVGGATDAVEKYMADRQGHATARKLPHAHVPTYFVSRGAGRFE